jgi:hypothetical protein
MPEIQMAPILVMATIPRTLRPDELGLKKEWAIRLGFASEADMKAYRRKWGVEPNHRCRVVEVSAAQRRLAAALANLIRSHLRASGL